MLNATTPVQVWVRALAGEAPGTVLADADEHDLLPAIGLYVSKLPDDDDLDAWDGVLVCLQGDTDTPHTARGELRRGAAALRMRISYAGEPIQATDGYSFWIGADDDPTTEGDQFVLYPDGLSPMELAAQLRVLADRLDQAVEHGEHVFGGPAE